MHEIYDGFTPRELKAIALQEAGMTYREMGCLMGYTGAMAGKIYQRACRKREKWIADNIAGEHNYQKSLTEEELKEKCWYNHRTEEEKEVYKDKFRGKNNPFKKAFLKNPEKYSGVNHPSYGRTGKKNLLSKKYIITLPNNEEYLVIGLKEFCRSYTEIKLLPCHFSECANGNKDTYKGFKCRHFDPTKDKNIKEWLTTDKKDANIQI